MRIVTVVGARPQFIKAAVVSRALQARTEAEELLIHTGQHWDDNMSGAFFRELGMPAPAHYLGIGGGTHGEMTGRMLPAIEQVLLEARPDWVLVYGDTNSTLAGALAAAKLNLPIAHVEAGLRSFNRRMPEEINRVVTDHLSQLLLAPTAVAVKNALAEGIPAGRIAHVGDVMFDAALFFGAKAERESRVLSELALARGEFVLTTIHRAENVDDPARLMAIVDGLLALARDLPVVWPLHPRTQSALQQAGRLSEVSAALRILPPLGYLDMTLLERAARVVATDSGGVQKEAFFAQVPCVTLREETEWEELVALGCNTLVPPVSAAAVAAGIRDARPFPADVGAPYGGGDAGPKIVELLLDPARAR